MPNIDRKHFFDTMMLFDTPDFDISKYIAKVPSPRDYDLRTKIETWNRDGVVIFENVVDTEIIDYLMDDITYFCRHPKGYDIEIEFRGVRYRLPEIDFDPLTDTGVKFNCLENFSFAARALSLNRFVVDFLSHVFQDIPVTLQSLTFWKGSDQPAHTDYPYVRTQTKLSHLAASWIPLEDVQADAGPLAYWPGSHKPNIIEPFDWGEGSVVMEPDSARGPEELAPYLYQQLNGAGIKPRVFLPKKGDLLIWHGWLVHEGTQTRNPDLTRKSYVTHYTSLDAYPKEHMHKDAFEKQRFTMLNGGYVFNAPWIQEDRSLPSWRMDE